MNLNQIALSLSENSFSLDDEFLSKNMDVSNKLKEFNIKVDQLDADKEIEFIQQLNETTALILLLLNSVE